MSESENCEICGAEFRGTAFTVVALTEPPRTVAVCEACADGQYVKIEIDGTSLTVDRDDYLRADSEELEVALMEADRVLADHGWMLEGLTLRASGGA